MTAVSFVESEIESYREGSNVHASALCVIGVFSALKIRPPASQPSGFLRTGKLMF